MAGYLNLPLFEEVQNFLKAHEPCVIVLKGAGAENA
jgi:hypothetical protein